VNKIEAAPSGQLSYATPRFEIIPKLHTPSEVEDFDVHPFLSKGLDLPTKERGSKRILPWFEDARFSDTPGASHAASHDRGIVYLRGSDVVDAPYLRVAPKWVERMKREVDRAGG
jgi:hypothetical protein